MMMDRVYTEKNTISEILRLSNRMRFLLMDQYKVKTDEIVSIRVDSENKKVDINLPEKLLRFKAKGVKNVLIPNIKTGGLSFTLDPALAMGIYEIIGDFG